MCRLGEANGLNTLILIIGMIVNMIIDISIDIIIWLPISIAYSAAAVGPGGVGAVRRESLLN